MKRFLAFITILVCFLDIFAQTPLVTESGTTAQTGCNHFIYYNGGDRYRTNKLDLYDRLGRKVYSVENYDTLVDEGQIERGEHCFDGSSLADGTYSFPFFYKGISRTIKHHGSLIIIR